MKEHPDRYWFLTECITWMTGEAKARLRKMEDLTEDFITYCGEKHPEIIMEWHARRQTVQPHSNRFGADLNLDDPQ